MAQPVRQCSVAQGEPVERLAFVGCLAVMDVVFVIGHDAFLRFMTAKWCFQRLEGQARREVTAPCRCAAA